MSRKQTEQTIIRHWEMLKLIPSRSPGLTTQELRSSLNAYGYDVDIRTIQRDLQTLSRLFPLVSEEESKPFKWHLMPTQRIQLPGFSTPEALSLQLIEKYMKSLLPHSILSVMESQFAQAQEKLDSIKSTNKQARWTDKIRVVSPAMPQLAPEIGNRILELVQDSLIDEVQIKIEYLRPQHNITSCWILHPLGLVQRGTISYLVCTMFDYSDVRIYALHRIKSIELLCDKINIPDNFDLDDYINDGTFHFGTGKYLKLEAHVNTDLLTYLKESPLSEDMKISSRRGSHKIKATVIDTWQLHWWILSQGSSIEVLKPIYLRKSIKKSLQETLVAYSD